jgi:phage terminase small subunit
MRRPQPEPIPFPEPPPHLSARAAGIWAILGPSHAPSLGRRILFQMALECLDRSDQARELIASQGLTSKTDSTGALHIHPAAKVEREARAQFAALWASLGLNEGHGTSELDALMRMR